MDIWMDICGGKKIIYLEKEPKRRGIYITSYYSYEFCIIITKKYKIYLYIKYYCVCYNNIVYSTNNIYIPLLFSSFSN